MKIDGAPFTCLTHAPPPRPAPRRDSRIPRQPNGPRNNCIFLLKNSRPLRMAEDIVKTAHVPVSFSPRFILVPVSFFWDPYLLSDELNETLLDKINGAVPEWFWTAKDFVARQL